MEHKIVPNSSTWRTVKKELNERRQELLERIVSVDCGHDETISIRGSIREIDRILDLERGDFFGIPGEV